MSQTQLVRDRARMRIRTLAWVVYLVPQVHETPLLVQLRRESLSGAYDVKLGTKENSRENRRKKRKEVLHFPWRARSKSRYITS